jgi:hypothetical protein
MSRTPMQDATDRLRALATHLSSSSLLQEDITAILDELHRLHVVVSTQRKQSEALVRKHLIDRGKTRPQEAQGRTKSPGRSPQHQAKTRKRKT